MNYIAKLLGDFFYTVSNGFGMAVILTSAASGGLLTDILDADTNTTMFVVFVILLVYAIMLVVGQIYNTRR